MIARARKTELMCSALRYSGDLLLAIMSTTTAFDDLSEEEWAFVEEYIESVGQRLVDQANARDPKNRAAAKAILRRVGGDK